MVKKKQAITIWENLIEIDIIKNLWDVLKRCRESYYYLLSLRNILKNEVVLLENRNNFKSNTINIKTKEFYNEISFLEKEYEEIEKVSFNNNKISEDNFNLAQKEAAIEREENNSDSAIKMLDENEIFNIIKKSIYLTEKIDKLQLSILQLLCDNRDKINESLAKKDDKLENLYLLSKQKYLTKIIFEHSVKEDKIDTYKLNSSNNEIKKLLRKKGIKLPYCIKSRDYSYMLHKLRVRFDMNSNLNMELISMTQVVKKEKELEKLNKKQYYFNIIVILFTVISTFIAAIQLILVLAY